MSTEPDKSADNVCKRIDSGNYDLVLRREPNNPAHEMAELPTQILGGVDSASDEELLKFVDGLSKALKEWRDNPSRKKELCTEKLQIRADVFDARRAFPSEGDIKWNPYANLPHVIIGISPTEQAVIKAYRLYDPFEELPCERIPN